MLCFKEIFGWAFMSNNARKMAEQTTPTFHRLVLFNHGTKGIPHNGREFTLRALYEQVDQRQVNQWKTLTVSPTVTPSSSHIDRTLNTITTYKNLVSYLHVHRIFIAPVLHTFT